MQVAEKPEFCLELRGAGDACGSGIPRQEVDGVALFEKRKSALAGNAATKSGTDYILRMQFERGEGGVGVCVCVGGGV